MPLRKTVFLKNTYYHVFSRGNHKSTIFFEDRDYRRFLEKLQIYKDQFHVSIINWSLLPNHFHLLAVSEKDDEGLPKMMQCLLSSHAHYISLKYTLLGHLFGGPFKAKSILDEPSFLQVFRYISLQPVKERILEPSFIVFGRKSRDLSQSRQLVKDLRSFAWGGYKEYLSPGKDSLSSKGPVFSLLNDSSGVRRFVEAKITQDDIFEFDALERL